MLFLRIIHANYYKAAYVHQALSTLGLLQEATAKHTNSLSTVNFPYKTSVSIISIDQGEIISAKAITDFKQISADQFFLKQALERVINY